MSVSSELRKFGQTLYYRSSVVRSLTHLSLDSLSKAHRTGTAHLTTFAEEGAMGPLQRSEALLLLAITKTLDPRVVVEFGFSHGHSAVNFLEALSADAMLYSFDISGEAQKYARRRMSAWKNFHFIKKSQADFSPQDIDDQQIDLLFIDAAHDLALNQATWQAVLPSLTENAVIAIHDTGTWNRKYFCEIHTKFAADKPDDWLNEHEFQHQKGEREFINWILNEHPDYSTIHLHTLRKLRHGMTLLQKKQPLPT